MGSGMLLFLPIVFGLLVAWVLMGWQAAQEYWRGEHKLPLSTMSASLPGTGMWSEKFILATQPAMADKGS